MALRIKSGTDLECVRKFGFALGSELAARPEFADLFDGCEYMFDWWHKFTMDPDNPAMPFLVDGSNPLVHAWVDTRDGKNLLWFDATPCYTYHIEMDDLDLITSTVFKLTQAGLIEEA